jgi:hypothetical protein
MSEKVEDPNRDQDVLNDTVPRRYKITQSNPCDLHEEKDEENKKQERKPVIRERPIWSRKRPSQPMQKQKQR